MSSKFKFCYLHIIISFIFSFVVYSPNRSLANTENAPIKKNQVEDIFIWKMSDELRLNAAEEKKFSEIHKSLNQKKVSLQSELAALSYEFRKKPSMSKKEITLTVKKIKKATQDYSQVSNLEFSEMLNLLGERRFLEYVAIKQDISLKLKNLLVGEDSNKFKSSVSSTTKSLSPPQIIEEK